MRSTGNGGIGEKKALVGLFLFLFVMAAGACVPKKVVRTPESSGPPGGAKTPAKSDPGLPPVIAKDNPVTPPYAGEIPNPRVRVASGPSRQGIEDPKPEGVQTGDVGARAAGLAKDQLGKQYQWGAAGPDKFDCSGLVMYVYNELGVPLPRVSGQQASSGVHIDRKNLRPGDLVFFKLNGSRIDHVGIYVGRNEFIHAPRRYMPVRRDSLNNAYWRQRYIGARRVG